MALGETPPVALLVHGWNDNPREGWFAWLGEQLEARGYVVRAPHFEVDGTRRFERWQTELNGLATELDERSVIVAHSLGCWLTLRMLEARSGSGPIGAGFFVAGFYDAPRPEAERFFSPEPDWDRVQQSLPARTVIYSDNDHVVTPDRSRRLAHKLDAELVCVPGHGHFLGSRGMETFPELLALLP